MKVPATNVRCPYCGHIQQLYLKYEGDHGSRDRQFSRCYPEEGGCDKEFVLDIKPAFAIETFCIHKLGCHP